MNTTPISLILPKRQAKAQQPCIYIIFNEEKKIALCLDGSNALKESSGNQAPPLSHNKKPAAAHYKSKKTPLEEVIMEENVKNTTGPNELAHY